MSQDCKHCIQASTSMFRLVALTHAAEWEVLEADICTMKCVCGWLSSPQKKEKMHDSWTALPYYSITCHLSFFFARFLFTVCSPALILQPLQFTTFLSHSSWLIVIVSLCGCRWWRRILGDFWQALRNMSTGAQCFSLKGWCLYILKVVCTLHNSSRALFIIVCVCFTQECPTWHLRIIINLLQIVVFWIF